MGYVDKNIAADENILYRAEIHWIVYKPAIALLILFTALFGAAAARPELNKYSAMVGGIGLLVALVAFIQAWIDRMTTEIAVTTRRVIVKVGLIRRTVMEMHANRIESLVVRQSVFGRILDYGTVIVKGTGAGIEPVQNVACPLKLRAAVADLCQTQR
jgi:uncharacterized membrane protein YdbT with pleckstrin-like domain